jgi:hypothetical protein
MGMHQLMRNIRDIERSLGDGVKQIYPSELNALKKLRRVNGNGPTNNNGDSNKPTLSEDSRFLYGVLLDPDPTTLRQELDQL